MGNSYRLDQIYASLVKNGSVNVNELAETFQVTPTTIRRDLLDLEERGLINRTRGAAYITGFSNQADILRDEKTELLKQHYHILEMAILWSLILAQPLKLLLIKSSILIKSPA